MKNIFKFAFVAFVSFGLSSCLKDEEFDASEVGLNAANIPDQPIIEIVGGGVSRFSNHVLSVDLSKASDTNRFRFSYTHKGLAAPEDITVTFGYNAAALASYNASVTNIQFEKLPDSTFSLPKTTATIKKGEKLSEFVDIIIFPGKVDPSKIYLLPISITSTSKGNSLISGNNAIIYLNIIGNALAGNYTTTGRRYNYSGSVSWSGPPAPFPAGFTDGTTAAYNGTVSAVAVDGQTVKIVFGNVPDPAPVGGSAFYYITGTNPAFTNITFTQGANFDAGYSNIDRYILNYVPPTATQKPSFRLITKYNNATGGAGSDRIVDQTFTKQ